MRLTKRYFVEGTRFEDVVDALDTISVKYKVAHPPSPSPSEGIARDSWIDVHPDSFDAVPDIIGEPHSSHTNLFSYQALYRRPTGVFDQNGGYDGFVKLVGGKLVERIFVSRGKLKQFPEREIEGFSVEDVEKILNGNEHPYVRSDKIPTNSFDHVSHIRTNDVGMELVRSALGDSNVGNYLSALSYEGKWMENGKLMRSVVRLKLEWLTG